MPHPCPLRASWPPDLLTAEVGQAAVAALIIRVVAVSLIGEAIRDSLDVRLRPR
jgi:hypothetical protein